MSKIKEAFWDEIEAQEDIIDDIRANGYALTCEMPAQKTTMADVKPREVAYPIIWQEEQAELVREWLAHCNSKAIVGRDNACKDAGCERGRMAIRGRQGIHQR